MVAESVTVLLGGSRMQVSGRTAAFTVVLAPVHARLGLQRLLLAGMLAGLLLIAMGLLRLGILITYVPHDLIPSSPSARTLFPTSAKFRHQLLQPLAAATN